MIIYVSGPYSAETNEGKFQNTQTAIDVGIELIRRGHTVIIPHLSHYTDMRAQELGVDISWETWMKQDLELLERCDALYFIGESKGANLELEKAVDWGLLIYYSVGEVPTVKENEPAKCNKCGKVLTLRKMPAGDFAYCKNCDIYYSMVSPRGLRLGVLR